METEDNILNQLIEYTVRKEINKIETIIDISKVYRTIIPLHWYVYGMVYNQHSISQTVLRQNSKCHSELNTSDS